MKKTMIALLAVVTIAVSCKKEETISGGGSTDPTSLILGNWKGDVSVQDVNISGTGFFDTVYTATVDNSFANYEFKNDGTVIYDSLGLNPETSNWFLVSNTIMSVDGQEMSIDLINATNLHLTLDSSFVQVPINFSIKNTIKMVK